MNGNGHDPFRRREPPAPAPVVERGRTLSPARAELVRDELSRIAAELDWLSHFSGGDDPELLARVTAARAKALEAFRYVEDRLEGRRPKEPNA